MNDLPPGAVDETRRRRPWITGVRAAVVVAVLALAVIVVVLARANRRERAARLEAERAQSRAEANDAMAREAVDGYFTQIAESAALRCRALMLNSLAVLLNQTGHPADAEKRLREVVEVQQALVARAPDRAEERRNLANAWLNLAETQGRLGRLDQARASCEASLALCDALIQAHPGEPGYSELEARARNNLGNCLHRTARTDEAETVLLEALATRWRLATEHPDAPRFQRDLASTLTNLGAVYLSTRRFTRARALLEEARRTWTELIQRQPDRPGHREALAGVEFNLAGVLRGLGDTARAEASFAAAAEQFDRVLEAHPEDARAVAGSAAAWAQAGDLARQREAWDTAVERLDRAVSRYQAILNRSPWSAEARKGYLTAVERRARALEGQGDFKRAALDWETARTRTAADHLADCLFKKGLTEARGGDQKSAVATAALHAREGATQPMRLVQAAQIYVEARAAIQKDPALPADAKNRQAENAAAAAVRALESARALGHFRNPDARKQLELFEALRDRADYRAFLDRVDGR